MKLVLIGGGNIPKWNFETKDENQDLYETKNIDEEIVKLSEKKNPKCLFIGTAKKDNKIYYSAIKNIYENLGCKVELLDTISENVNYQYLEEKILNTDIIYVGGGNTRFLLERWKQIGLDKLIKDIVKKDIVIAGFSAGAYAMCKYSYDLIQGLNILNFMLCVHYNEKSNEKKNMFEENILKHNINGIALDNSVALVVCENDFKIIKDYNERNAYKLSYENGKIKKTMM